MSEKFVIVHRSYDPVQSDMLGDILRQNDIDARVLGTRHGAVIGVGQNILQMHIEVPRSQAGAATDFLEAFFESDGEALLREALGLPEGAALSEGASEDVLARAEEQLAAREDDVRRPLFAAGSALILGIIGGGHLYAQRPWTALLLTVGQVFAIVLMLSAQWSEVATGQVAFATLVTIDLLISQWAVRAHNRGVRVTVGRQLITGVALVALAGSLSSFLGPQIPEPDTDEQQRTGVAAPAY